MDIKNYVTLTIAVIIGVVMISGVVAPVIADVSSNSGGGGTVTYRNDQGDYTTYYTKITEDLTFLVSPSDGGNTFGVYIGEDFIPCYGDPFYFTDFTDIILTGNQSGTYFSYNGVRYAYGQVSEGSVTLYRYSTGDVYHEFDNALYCVSQQGEYVLSYDDEDYPVVYLSEDSEVYLVGSDDSGRIKVIGSANNNTAMWTDGSDSVELDPATFNFVGDVLKSVTVFSNGVEVELFVSYIESDPPDDDSFYMNTVLVPTTVTVNGGGSGGSLSPTLTAMLSVVPLVMVVGLVMGAFAYFKLKD